MTPSAGSTQAVGLQGLAVETQAVGLQELAVGSELTGLRQRLLQSEVIIDLTWLACPPQESGSAGRVVRAVLLGC